MSLIAIFSDVHGNLPALQAVLKDIEKRKADQVYCLGDLVDFAPWTNEVIETIRALQIPCLMGNHDERIAFDYEIIPLQKHSQEETKARTAAINYTKRTIKEECKAYLAGLPRQMKLTYNIKGIPVNLRLVHGSTRSNEEYIYENHDLNDIYEMLGEQQTDILVMGHTHESYIRTIASRAGNMDQIIINCGSAGRSKEGKPLATYLLIAISEEGIKPELVKLAYPVNKVINGILESDIPGFYADFLKS
ncbi:putative phosphoesterase [Pedobacter cryoconitis]|uniref:metallophosphoesterase family protein n=1 Tax=Pedobacter cryoconitis TaxID=188932 RepID=UPI001620C9FC|nr:metallophosphoesterase family protein [Pedobacter cryoconitis]MBB6270520.1 putative phosphoesterase [Pedobacter cryoconitis]